MSAVSNKYYVLKKLKPDYLILITTNKNKLGLTSDGLDRYFLLYINKNYFDVRNQSRSLLYKKLDELHINYLILDGLTIRYETSYEDNNYGKILLDVMLAYLLG